MALPVVLARQVAIRPIFKLTSRNYGAVGYWNKDWMPSLTIPKTKEEKAAAAKKYGLIPEDYETYPDNGMGYGDYPKLPIVPSEQRSPYEVIEHNALTRNYAEPLHIDADAYTDDKWNRGEKLYFTIPRLLFYSCAAFGSCIFLMTILPSKNVVRGLMGKSMPKEGKVHYSFELEK